MFRNAGSVDERFCRNFIEIFFKCAGLFLRMVKETIFGEFSRNIWYDFIIIWAK